MRKTFGNILLCKYSGAVKIAAQILRLGQKQLSWGGNKDLSCSCHVVMLEILPVLGKCPIFQSPKQLHDGLSTPEFLYCLIACAVLILQCFWYPAALPWFGTALGHLTWSCACCPLLHALSCLFKSFGSAEKALSHSTSLKKMVRDLWGGLRHKRNRRENDNTEGFFVRWNFLCLLLISAFGRCKDKVLIIYL